MQSSSSVGVDFGRRSRPWLREREGPSSAGRDSAIGAYRPEVHPYRTQYITYLEKISRLQIAIAAVCSLEICYIILNTSVKDRNIGNFIIPAAIYLKNHIAEKILKVILEILLLFYNFADYWIDRKQY